MRKTSIELKNITKSFGDNPVLEQFSLQVETGETVAIVGESGCGKTTLLRILAGIDREYSGEVWLDGVKSDDVQACDRGMALVFQEPTLWNHMTVCENILFSVTRSERHEAEERMLHICEKLGIEGLLARYPDEISGGQAKRVSLARAMVSNREILLLDEPLSNIDNETRERVMSFLREEYLGRKTLIYVSHDMGEVENLCDRVVRL